MRIARRAVMHVLAGEIVGVFAHVERADQDRAGGFHALDQRRVAAAGVRSRLILDPARVESPFTSNRFFTANGTPAREPASLPATIAASIALAFDRARSAMTSVNAFSTGLWAAIRASALSVAASADIFRAATACAISAAESRPACCCTGVSGCKDTGRLGFIGEREFVDHPRQSQRHLEIGAHRRFPGVFDRQRQRFGDGVNVVIETVSAHGISFSEPAAAGEESLSAVLLCSRPADHPIHAPTSPAPQFGPTASQ